VTSLLSALAVLNKRPTFDRSPLRFMLMSHHLNADTVKLNRSIAKINTFENKGMLRYFFRQLATSSDKIGNCARLHVPLPIDRVTICRPAMDGGDCGRPIAFRPLEKNYCASRRRTNSIIFSFGRCPH
jgi:hypothetical protein